MALTPYILVAYYERIKAIDKRPGEASESVLHLKGGKGKEPRCFTQHFVAWSPVPSHDDDGLGSVPEYLAQYERKYTYQELVDRQFPAGIDVANLENYLEDDEFEGVLGMSREEFAVSFGCTRVVAGSNLLLIFRKCQNGKNKRSSVTNNCIKLLNVNYHANENFSILVFAQIFLWPVFLFNFKYQYQAL